MTTFSLLEDIADEFVWETIATTRDETGQILRRDTVFDSGLSRSQDFIDGVLAGVTLSDAGPDGGGSDLRPWAWIEIGYDAEDLISSFYQLNDDGTQIARTYLDGDVVFSALTDLDPFGGPSDTKPWERIETFYDGVDNVDRVVRLNDDGTTVTKTYDLGVLRSIERRDPGEIDHKPWESITSTFDQNGFLVSRYRLNDDGTEVRKEYDAGVLQRVERIDFPTADQPLGVQPWEAFVTQYDQNGDLQSRVVFLDNGIISAKYYTDGVLTSSDRLDRDSSFEVSERRPWDIQTTLFDEDGKAADQFTRFDSGDLQVVLFQPQSIFPGVDLGRIRLYFDMDESEPWQVREMLLDQDRKLVALNTFDDLADLPVEYGIEPDEILADLFF